MKSLRTMRENRIYHLQAELEAIKDDMANAMQRANVSYVATKRPTMHMATALQRFYDWAERAKEAGL